MWDLIKKTNHENDFIWNWIETITFSSFATLSHLRQPHKYWLSSGPINQSNIDHQHQKSIIKIDQSNIDQEKIAQMCNGACSLITSPPPAKWAQWIHLRPTPHSSQLDRDRTQISESYPAAISPPFQYNQEAGLYQKDSWNWLHVWTRLRGIAGHQLCYRLESVTKFIERIV